MGWQAAAAVFAAYGAYTASEAAEEQKDATKRQVAAQGEQQRQQKRLADIKGQRERRKMVREQRIAQSQLNVASRGETAGSRVAGASGSVLTQAASAAGFAGQQKQIGQSIFDQGQIATAAGADIASAQAKGQIGGAISSLSSVALNPSVQSIFKST